MQTVVAGLGRHLPAGTQLNGIYEIDEPLAAGGMGEIYRGHAIQTGDAVAIKVIRGDVGENEAALALFRKEASALHHLHHEAIVRYFVFSIDPTLGRAYLAMEFVEGQSLSQLLNRGALTRAAVDLLRKRLGSGLHAAHERGIIHRDVAPDNILVPQGDVSRAKIIDFGIARSTRLGEGTIIGSGFAGKYNYVSPEQLGLFGGNVAAQSDIYSLALVLVEALRGRALDMGGSQVEVIEKRRSVPDLSDVDAGLRPLLQHMLQPDPAARPASMQEVVDWDPGKKRRPAVPISKTRPPQPAGAPQKKSGAALWAGAAAVVALLVGGGGYLYTLAPAPTVLAPPPAPTLTEAPRLTPPTQTADASPPVSAPQSGSPTSSGSAPDNPPPSSPQAAAPVSVPTVSSPVAATPVIVTAPTPPVTAALPSRPAEPPTSAPTSSAPQAQARLDPPRPQPALPPPAAAPRSEPSAASPPVVASTPPPVSSPSVTRPAAPAPAAPPAPPVVARIDPPAAPAPVIAPAAPTVTPPAPRTETPRPQIEARLEPPPTRPQNPVVTPPPPVVVPTPAEPPVAIAPPLSAADRITRYITDYRGGDCFYVAPTQVSTASASLEGFGLSTAPFERLDDAFKTAFGFEADIGVRLITPAQCAVIGFMAQAGADPKRAPTLTIPKRELRSGQEVSGTVQTPDNASVDLVAVGDDGVAQVLTVDGSGSSRTFAGRLARPKGSSPGAKPQVVLAVSSSSPLAAIRTARLQPADRLFRSLLDEIQSKKPVVGLAAATVNLD